jgi:hypothetical protein
MCGAHLRREVAPDRPEMWCDCGGNQGHVISPSAEAHVIAPNSAYMLAS